jgi:hypothetical protein
VICPVQPFNSFYVQVSVLKNLFKNAVHYILSKVVIQIIYDVIPIIAIASEGERNLER